MKSVGVLYAPGINSHAETMFAFEKVGAKATLLYLSEILKKNQQLDQCDLLCLPGGFAYGDHLGAGALLGDILRISLTEQLERAKTRPILAICNGFQTGVRAGLFGDDVTLSQNDCGHFVNIVDQTHVVVGDSPWFTGMRGAHLVFSCAHGEGRFSYTSKENWKTELEYPSGQNPDGSQDNIAGISSGLSLGMMDHPERVLTESNLQIFSNGLAAI